MSYEKQTWVSGELITSAKLNHMEDGIKTLSETDPLPAVTTADNGKMLVVNEGAWGVGDVPSNAVVFAGEGVGSTVQGLIGNSDPANNNLASGDYAHAEGGNAEPDEESGDFLYLRNNASGTASHAEGANTTASASYSHAEGVSTTANGIASHAEGTTTTASGDSSHAEGGGTTASGGNSHAEGANTTASGTDSHAEGYGGKFTIDNVEYTSGAIGMADHTEGYQTLTANAQPGNHAEGYRTQATGGAAHAEGSMTFASGSQSHAEGGNTTASGARSHAEGSNTKAEGDCSHAEGGSTTASGNLSHAEGANTLASGTQSHAEGYGDKYTRDGTEYASGAKGVADHTEGFQTLTASASFEGSQGNHAEGYRTQATGGAAHAEGSQTVASGYHAHAEGNSTTASGGISHAEGVGTTAGGAQSHAEGAGTIANHASQHVFGECNVADPSTAAATKRGTYVEIVGNGTSSAKSNARTLDWSGNEVLAGKLTVGAAPTADMDVATKKYVDDMKKYVDDRTTFTDDTEVVFERAFGLPDDENGDTSKEMDTDTEEYFLVTDIASSFKLVDGGKYIVSFNDMKKEFVARAGTSSYYGSPVEIQSEPTDEMDSFWIQSYTNTVDNEPRVIMSTKITSEENDAISAGTYVPPVVKIEQAVVAPPFAVGAAGITIGSTTITEAQLQALLATLA